jgi:signal transduction histidine kinase
MSFPPRVPPDRQARGGAPLAASPAAALPGRPRRAAHLLIAGVVAGAVAVAVLARGALAAPGAVATLAPWLVATVLAELLWLPTLTGRATSSMASTVNFAALFILGPAAALWVVAPAAAIATVLIQRRSLLRGLYNFAQMALTIAVAGWFHAQSGGAPAALHAFREPAAVVPFLNAGLAYFAVNTGLVAAVVALWEGEPFWRAWRENYGYADDLATTLALFLLSPLMVLAFLALGPAGLAFFFVPMLMVRNASARYIELRAAHEQVVWNERMAAMGEMAAEIGHELSNALQVITARAQMLLTDPQGVQGERASRAARVIFERVADMRRLTKGLMDFSHREIVRRREPVNGLIQDAIEFVSPQNRYEHVGWRLALDPAQPEADLDGSQLRQVLLNLFQNAVEAMAETATPPWIAVSTQRRGGWVELRVRDGGPGFPEGIRERAFEPWLTTKPGGHGFGLAVCYRIILAHGGTIEAVNPAGGGAEIVIRLPAAQAARRAA